MPRAAPSTGRDTFRRDPSPRRGGKVRGREGEGPSGRSVSIFLKKASSAPVGRGRNAVDKAEPRTPTRLIPSSVTAIPVCRRRGRSRTERPHNRGGPGATGAVLRLRSPSGGSQGASASPRANHELVIGPVPFPTRGRRPSRVPKLPVVSVATSSGTRPRSTVLLSRPEFRCRRRSPAGALSACLRGPAAITDKISLPLRVTRKN